VSSRKTLTGSNTQDDVYAFSNADNEVVLANIGDYGAENSEETLVAELVKSWVPDAVFTNGDNSQADNDYDDDVYEDYSEFVDRNILWPCPGNHDWDDGDLGAYFGFFGDVVNDRYYYKKQFGPVTLWMLDGNSQTPDGNTADSPQAQWLARECANSRSPWNIACIHQPPYSSSIIHPSSEDMQWLFADAGIDIVFSGHNHQYERISKDGIYYIVNGLGGQAIYNFDTPIDGSEFRYNALHGAGKLIATPTKLVWKFFSYDGAEVDSLTLEK
jgi:hypothetical protein